MQKAIISFVISLVLGFGLGYLVFDVVMGGSDEAAKVAQADNKETPAATEESTESKEDSAATTSASDNILNQKGCLGCHAVESLDLKGGATGPDLSKAFENVEGKHGKPIEEFLKEPTSAVMSSVIGGNPLTDEERTRVVDMLKQASEK
ncbi:cytochrome C [Bacillus sp. FJAT-29814]|uniref:cytochrome C n=1 Tax=Bacillus sp. FJAT-29814 TaxID=1729688 RepID=UPI000829CEDF|nr:cytochrome C [Bacillus sp. FJAT-29814]